MGEIRELSEISRRWKEASSQKANEYLLGVQNPRRSWAEAAAKAEDSYKDAIIKAANEGRFGKGIKKVGDAKWLTRAVQLGAQRYVPGVQIAEEAHRLGFEPYHGVIKSLTYPPRFATGDPRNLDRVKVGAAALRQKKLQLLGVG